MRFGTYRATYRVATQHFGATAAYRRLYHTPVQLAAVLPFALTKTNPVTMRTEASGAVGTSLVSSLFSTSLNNSSVISPAGDLSSLGKSAQAACSEGVTSRVRGARLSACSCL
ncbi:uncharacterized protein LOC113147111 [Cyclospora cayetanensis]|uniref:Uncharacterized protein LOC113147111 n=1 Tax=Cyclospora cayetanensis TaxID=88456 RepID=A0A6P6RXL1_9EIME|nr:uncharacterized protein LOC113147111 [Cyclospora cayetanensis]